MTEALENHEGTVSIGGRTVTDLRFADDIDGLAGSEDELISLITTIDQVSTKYGMEINTDKTKIMTNNPAGFSQEVVLHGKALEQVKNFKYLGAIVAVGGSKPEICARIAQASAALAKLKQIWTSSNISLAHKMKLANSLVVSIFLYGCESWTLNAALEKKINAFEMKVFRRLLNISWRDYITNDEVRGRLADLLPEDNLLTTIKKRKLRWYGHVTRSEGLSKTFLQGTVPGTRGQGRPKKSWTDNVTEWTNMSMRDTLKTANNRDEWKNIIRNINSASTT